MFESADDGRRDDGCLTILYKLIYELKLTHEPKGLGELTINRGNKKRKGIFHKYLIVESSIAEDKRAIEQ